MTMETWQRIIWEWIELSRHPANRLCSISRLWNDEQAIESDWIPLEIAG